jgi:hypothetical protein
VEESFFDHIGEVQQGVNLQGTFAFAVLVPKKKIEAKMNAVVYKIISDRNKSQQT